MKILTHKGEKFMMYYELIELTDRLMSKEELTPYRISEIRVCLEKAWIELNAEYSKGGGYFSEMMFQYYLHGCFESKFGTSIN
jgi:hypothetical protein